MDRIIFNYLFVTIYLFIIYLFIYLTIYSYLIAYSFQKFGAKAHIEFL
jgi:hypothetical protein